MKKFGIGLTAIVLAIGFSAFTYHPRPASDFTFYRTSGLAGSVSAADYQYRPAGGCDPNGSSNCRATWHESYTGTPATDAHPTGTIGTIVTGEWNGN